MKEILYNQSSALIVVIVIVVMLVAVEAGFRGTYRKRTVAKESVRSQVNSVLGSMLGLLALLLAFTFSLALQRYEDRSQAIVAEANAIGTAYLRAQLLPKDMRLTVKATLAKYLDIRVQEGQTELVEKAQRSQLLAESDKLAGQLWQQAQQASELASGHVITALYIASLNELIDASGIREAALERHVPEIVLFLLFATCFMTMATLGYASGLGGDRVSLPGIVLVLLIAFVVYLIIDLDRPRRGAIQVSQESLIKLQQSFQ